ncbi:cytochrome P450 [Streptomyces sp. RFCAC02]|uniref:cytochrome P450 n=1 Tax=Streptomyces sp. RFCAC02 TaxID=2499143 RepID=UPI0019D02A85|nr:cytochrome P450 [Streptomyces sp. RFCAC02]
MTPHSFALPSTGPTPVGTLPRVRAADQTRLVARLLLPALAEGVIRRRPLPMALAQRARADRGAIDELCRLRERYGPGPLRLTPAGRDVAVVLEPDDLARMLAETPDPFTPAAWEKRRALDRFQPHGSLITRGPRRAARREVNERALQWRRPLHDLAPAVTARVADEAAGVLRAADGCLTWDGFAVGWWRSVRRVVLGDGAAGDDLLTDRLARLRSAGNWSFLMPRRHSARAAFLDRLAPAVAAAGPDTLAGRLPEAAAEAGASDTEAAGQVPHWLFAFDAAGAATLRTLALLAGHPEAAERARAEAADGDPASPRPLPYLRACVEEAVRLWPTTPLLLRESTGDTVWHGTVVPAGTAFAAFTPYFHRARPAGPYGDAFVPEIWLDGRAERDPALVPFSGGPGVCPGENVVLLTATAWLAALIADRAYAVLSPGAPRADAPVPPTIDHFGLRLAVGPA